MSLEAIHDTLTYQHFMATNLKQPGKSPLPEIFNRDPELKKEIEAYLAKIPESKKKEDLAKFEKFIEGEMTWAEIKGFPKAFLKALAKTAYHFLKTGNFIKAESLFKGLAIIDHTNWYYRMALGSVYQHQKLYDEAIQEYSMALMMNENEVSSLTNRGECLMKLKKYKEALADFKKVVLTDPKLKTPWAKRAKVMMEHLLGEGHA